MTNFTSSRCTTSRYWLRSTCCEASPSPVSPITMNEKSLALRHAGGAMANALAGSVGPSATTARTMASRHVSARSSAQEFQTPTAQFSVSKYQLMPKTGTVAAMIAANGRPICSARLKAERNEYRACRSRIENRSRRVSIARRARRAHSGRSGAASRHHCQARRSSRRVSLRHRTLPGMMRANAARMATTRSPSTATPGERMPRNVRSKPMRPMWIANSVAINAAIQPRSIGPRAVSSSARRSASVRSSSRSGRPRSLTVVCPASPAVNTGDRKMFQAVPKMRTAPATATVQAKVCPRRASSSANASTLARHARTWIRTGRPWRAPRTATTR